MVQPGDILWLFLMRTSVEFSCVRDIQCHLSWFQRQRYAAGVTCAQQVPLGNFYLVLNEHLILLTSSTTEFAESVYTNRRRHLGQPSSLRDAESGKRPILAGRDCCSNVVGGKEREKKRKEAFVGSTTLLTKRRHVCELINPCINPQKYPTFIGHLFESRKKEEKRMGYFFILVKGGEEKWT